MRERPENLPNETKKVILGCEYIDEHGENKNKNLYITTTIDRDGNLFEIFANLGKSGNCQYAMMEGLCRTISVALRIGIDPGRIAKQLIGIRCDKPMPFDHLKTQSCIDAIGKVLKKYSKQ